MGMRVVVEHPALEEPLILYRGEQIDWEGTNRDQLVITTRGTTDVTYDGMKEVPSDG